MTTAPALSRTERDKVCEAARLYSIGTPARWRIEQMTCSYWAGRSETRVFTANHAAAFRSLCDQARELFWQEVQKCKNT